MRVEALRLFTSDTARHQIVLTRKLPFETQVIIGTVSIQMPTAPFGRYKNLFLSESEYAELKGEYPDRLERFIEELSEYIAAYGKVYTNHAAAVRMWAKRDRKGTGKKGIPDYSYKEGESL